MASTLSQFSGPIGGEYSGKVVAGPASILVSGLAVDSEAASSSISTADYGCSQALSATGAPASAPAPTNGSGFSGFSGSLAPASPSAAGFVLFINNYIPLYYNLNLILKLI
ncbi:hypothetical protein OC709_02545 ['Planchonia careya' phytoplasma]|nr:hypothetical protein ['Planchonia careya' phytoplasma]MDO8030369.1 hypothetical protein ['Planchonia careya' phytoplasma]